jgi:predicted nucleic acid-binding protein
MPFVMDASVALSWCFEDEASSYADRVQDMLARDVALVPSIWPFEVANALRTAERRRRLRAAEVMRFAELLHALPIMVDSALLPRALGPILAVARACRLTCYDACYVELAVREGIPLATQDKRLQDACAHVGVSRVP